MYSETETEVIMSQKDEIIRNIEAAESAIVKAAEVASEADQRELRGEFIGEQARIASLSERVRTGSHLIALGEERIEYEGVLDAMRARAS